MKASGGLKRPKITFLDAATLDLGDLNLQSIRRLGRYRAFPACRGNRIPQAAGDADVIITNKMVLGKEEMQALPKLRLICVSATGVNNIDLEAAGRLGIAVTNVAAYSTPTVVEHALMLMLAFAHRLPEHDAAVKRGDWSRSPLFTLLDYPFSDLNGKTLGVVGYGTIGKKLAQIARHLGMKIVVAALPGRKYHTQPRRHSLDQVLRQSDFLSLHTALTPRTRGLINRKRLTKMKPAAYLLNLARGPVVVERDVVWALEKNRLAGYGADVTETEPLPKDHPFLKKSLAKKLLLTPHVAWASRESRQRLVDEIAKNIRAFRLGRRRNRVD